MKYYSFRMLDYFFNSANVKVDNLKGFRRKIRVKFNEMDLIRLAKGNNYDSIRF